MFLSLFSISTSSFLSPCLRFQNNANNNINNNQQQLILSRKSSASSTGSLDKQQQQQAHSKSGGAAGGKNSGGGGHPAKVRHDEHSMKSVRDKIALFSQGKNGGRCHHQSTEDIMSRALSSNSLMMTRAYTHGDVRYLGGEAPPTVPNANVKNGTPVSGVYHRSMVNVSGGAGGRSAFMTASNKSVSSADLSGVRRGMPATNGRSQSLLEIGNVVINNSNRSHLNNTLPKSETANGRSRSSTSSKVSNNVTIQESHHETGSNGTSPYNSLETDMSEARQVSIDGGRISLTTPPLSLIHI